eukprot:CAMPEP_0182930878 /NCGR_PEP_ID=MMETSP0105_2-20130417/26619_1 /TAXON_ID=81532 ORGANISM="Acanthoeca-like sp., Strain 10tr" /NCGR_SAMPLE_ID=MMETSP0105_2 /ASSEMBLY_ACC=CAM_ASM_000205 /LENGTH=146 /DNA_ID=CAMNT_0025069219 /DNA_START=113 /DNA_END=554 /DNA_ORIENTATION=-
MNDLRRAVQLVARPGWVPTETAADEAGDHAVRLALCSHPNPRGAPRHKQSPTPLADRLLDFRVHSEDKSLRHVSHLSDVESREALQRQLDAGGPAVVPIDSAPSPGFAATILSGAGGGPPYSPADDRRAAIPRVRCAAWCKKFIRT